MSSYYPSFNYLGINSRDCGLVVSHFDADQGENDTFLGMEPIYTESADGSRRLDYGAKFNNVATFRLTVIKSDGGDFSVTDVRDSLKWLTGSRKNSSLDLIEHFSEEFICDNNGTPTFELVNTCDHIFNIRVGDSVASEENQWTYDSGTNSVTPNSICAPKGTKAQVSYGRIKYSFIGRITNAWQYKMDARTVGLIFEFTSVSPWAYSARQIESVEVNGLTFMTINNKSDDLYGYTPVNTIFENSTGDSLQIINQATSDITTVTDIVANEVVTISDNMMITSDKGSKIFGNSFNFVFPRLVSGENVLEITGVGKITFEYVYCIKIGDCAMDINVISDPICDDEGHIQLDTLPWNRIIGTPTTYQGYGITNVYSKVEVDMLLADIQIDENELSAMLVEELN